MISVGEIELPVVRFNDTQSFDGRRSEPTERRRIAHRIIEALVEAKLIGANPVEAVIEILSGENVTPENASEISRLRAEVEELEDKVNEARRALD